MRVPRIKSVMLPAALPEKDIEMTHAAVDSDATAQGLVVSEKENCLKVLSILKNTTAIDALALPLSSSRRLLSNAIDGIKFQNVNADKQLQYIEVDSPIGSPTSNDITLNNHKAIAHTTQSMMEAIELDNKSMKQLIVQFGELNHTDIDDPDGEYSEY